MALVNLLNEGVRQVVEQFDYGLSRMYLRCFKEQNALITFLFHGLLFDEKEKALGAVDPHQFITVELFRQFIEYYLACGYTFISVPDILAGLAAEKKYILLTFDDGYHNNIRVLPLLKEYRIPALFFISTGHVLKNKSFWWDVVYRERRARGVSDRALYHEITRLKKMTTEAIESYLVSHFGKQALIPKGEIDRPFTPSELKTFSREPYVFLGNHTSDHAILTNYDEERMKNQIRAAQEDLKELCGYEPEVIAFPGGAYSKKITRFLKDSGFKLAITVEAKKNHLPIITGCNKLACLGRFIINGNGDLMRQCITLRSDFVLKHALKLLNKDVF